MYNYSTRLWHAYPTSDGCWGIFYVNPPPGRTRPIELSVENAKLIGAAPDLLEGCAWALSYEVVLPPDLVSYLRWAIEEAT